VRWAWPLPRGRLGALWHFHTSRSAVFTLALELSVARTQRQATRHRAIAEITSVRSAIARRCSDAWLHYPLRLHARRKRGNDSTDSREANQREA
jgi:hypothetical protein